MILIFNPVSPPILIESPFIEDQICDQLRRLPIAKALAPDGLPALIWKHFAWHHTCMMTLIVFGAMAAIVHQHAGLLAGSTSLLSQRHFDRFIFNTP